MIHEVQYPQRQGPVEDPSLFSPPAFSQADQRQKFPRRWAQQPNSYTSPVTTPAPVVFSDALNTQKFPRRWAQQPPSYAGIVLDPSLFARPQFFDATGEVKRPRRWAQQPNSYAGPVLLIAAAASTRRRFAQIV